MPNGHQSPRGPVPIQDVIKKTLSGIAKAQRDYEAWSGGSWLWEAPEYMLTTYIAKELWTIPGSKYLTLESHVRRTLKDAGGFEIPLVQKAFWRHRGDKPYVWLPARPASCLSSPDRVAHLHDRSNCYRLPRLLPSGNPAA